MGGRRCVLGDVWSEGVVLGEDGGRERVVLGEDGCVDIEEY